jgi:hypothetical protein
MPRNPNKTHCTEPGCRNWAMRGRAHCSAHRTRDRAKALLPLAKHPELRGAAKHPSSAAETASGAGVAGGAPGRAASRGTKDRAASRGTKDRAASRGTKDRAASSKHGGEGNLNALKHGRHSHPLPLPDLERLAADAIAGEPGDFACRIDRALRALQARTGWRDASGDPFLTLVALRRLFSQLTALVAGKLFDAELQAAMGSLPRSVAKDPPDTVISGQGEHSRREAAVQARALLHGRIARCAAQIEPEARLCLLRKIKKRKKTITRTGTGTGTRVASSEDP